jgi:transcriptional regulator with XRE-family HTH domain
MDHDEFAINFGAHMRQLREAKGMSQREVALAIGTKMEAYRKYETRSPLPLHLVPRVAGLFGVDIGSMFVAAALGTPMPRKTNDAPWMRSGTRAATR